MVTFIEFKTAVQHQFNSMKKHKLFTVGVDKDQLWTRYLQSFPPGTNPIYKERTEHDCQCCRSFIRNIGDLVAIVDGRLVSIWDLKVPGFYQEVADALSHFVKTDRFITDVFLKAEPVIGVDKNYSNTDDNRLITWNHFHVQLPKEVLCKADDIGTRLSNIRTGKEVFQRSLNEISREACETVLELIAQNSLYRGEEHAFAITEFLKFKTRYDPLDTDHDCDIFCWSNLDAAQSVLRIKNTAIGTLLCDLSEGRDLEGAVKSFEAKVAPANYKRPTALVTKAMVESARQTIEQLGLTASLQRRFAVLEDVSVNNILFVDRSVKANLQGNVFDSIAKDITDKPQSFDKVEEVSIEKFIFDILPKASSLEVLFERGHKNKLVSLIAPSDFTAKNLFKWDNPFSWSYTGDLADSIKERVKKAGGEVEGDLRCSLSWFNYDDLDLHLIEPSGNEIFFRNKMNPFTSGQLDVDMNAGMGRTRTPVENIFYRHKSRMLEGTYKLAVNQFYRRETIDVGFSAEIDFEGSSRFFHYDKAVIGKVLIASFNYTHKDGIQYIKTLPSETGGKSETVWNIPTEAFHRVNLMMLSPNHWNDRAVGNRHYFFFLDGCLNDGVARGFYNEFLSADLDPHRKVMEVVGCKMKTDESSRQLSGLGFSSTQRNALVCKVGGSFTRVIKVLF